MRYLCHSSRRFVSPLLLGVLFLVLVLGSCGRVDTSRRIILWEQMDPKEQQEYDKNLVAFREAHPEFADFSFERVHYRPEDLQTQFQTAALAYGGPSLVYGPADKIGVYAIMGLLMPVNDLLPQSEIDRFDPKALPIIDKKVYGLPDNVGNHLTLVANMALVDTIAANTDDWLQQLRATTVDSDGDGKPEQYGLVFNLLEPFWLVPWLGGFGGWVMDDQFQPTLDTVAMRGALQFLYNLKQEHVVPLECDYPLADTIFQEGRAAYIINGPWSWQGYREAGIDIRLAPIPMVSETGLWPTPMTSAKCYSINRYLNEETYEVTAALLEFMTSREVQLGLAKTLSVQPADLVARADPEILADPTLRASRDQIDKGRLMPIVPEMRAIWDAMRPNYQSVINGELTPEEAASRMQDRAALMIERMRE
jgi:arabinogalactan oligomer / maltooligosaccharide transport system substrate-binding protein/arabinogalactan oligomer / maltooligosaccharide transport system permease protein